MNANLVVELAKISRQAEALKRAMDNVMVGTTPDHAKWGAVNSFIGIYNRYARMFNTNTGQSAVIFDEGRLKPSGDTVWAIQKQHFDQLYAELLILMSNLSEFDTGLSFSISGLTDLLSTNLRKVIFEKPDTELQVQNAVETLLVGRGYQKGVHYDRESGRVRFSGKDFIPDFNFHSLHSALEIKLIKEAGNPSQIVEQLSADIPAYKSHYPNVIFCVYDLGALRDIHEFENGLQNTDGVRVCVVKH